MPSAYVDDLHIICASPDDIPLAAFEKHLQPAGPPNDHDKNCLGCMQVAFLATMLHCQNGFLQLGAYGVAALQFWKTISCLVTFVLVCGSFHFTLSPIAIEVAPAGCSCRLLFARQSELLVPTEG